MFDSVSRRDFLRSAIAAGAMIPAVGLGSAAAAATLDDAGVSLSPNERLNIAVIGTEGQGAYNRDNVGHENIVALCDIDANRLAVAHEKYPHAKTMADYRRVFDLPNLDAVVISTPDFMHAIPAAIALRQGLAVYCEKPLTHTVWECRTLRNLAASNGCVTQMGTQIHAGDNYRRVVEAVSGGQIGPVNRVHVWIGGRVSALKRLEEPVPAGVDYDLWLGPAKQRPFGSDHFHFKWRYWFDFGGGQLADFGCHYMDLPFWALQLGAPRSVEVTRSEMGHTGDNDCPSVLQVDYMFPARGEQPAVHLTWYQGGAMPAGAEMYASDSAVLFEGTQGKLLADYSSRQVFMSNGGEPAAVPESIPNSIGHHAEFLAAIRSGGKTTCNFDYSGGLTEAVLLGNVAYKSAGKRIEWDAAAFRITNDAAANDLLHKEYRRGWTL